MLKNLVISKDKSFNFARHIENELFSFWVNLGESFIDSYLWDKYDQIVALVMSRLSLDMANDTVQFVINIFMDELLEASDAKSEFITKSKHLAQTYNSVSLVNNSF